MLFRRLVLFFLLLLIPNTPNRTLAQAQVQGTTYTNSNLHAGPAKSSVRVASLAAGVTVSVEARDDTSNWLLVHSADGKRGWILARQVKLKEPVNSLPISTEIIGPASQPVPPAPAPSSSTASPVDSLAGSLKNPASYAAQMTPAVRATVKRIYAQGQALGENPNVFARVGDCLSQGAWFFTEYGTGDYNLGHYPYLQSVINRYSVPTRPGAGNSFTVVSQAALGGFTTYRMLDSTWTDPALCQSTKSPVLCEYELNKPSVAIINLGLVDTQSGNTLAQYTADLQTIVDITIQHGIVPILVEPAQTPEHIERARAIGNVVKSIAARRNLPLIRLGDALANYPHNGLDYDGIHLTPYLEFRHADFNNMKYGFDVWNYLALQSLYNVLQVVGQ